MLIPNVLEMNDETLMRHLEHRHGPDLKMEFGIRPGDTERRLAAPDMWRTYHDTLHRIAPENYEHQHLEG